MIETLKTLGKFSISMEIHSKTKVGPLVNQIKKEGGNSDVQSIAKALLGKWKKVQAAQQGKASSASNASSTGEVTDKQTSGVAGKAGRNSDTNDCVVDTPDDGAANLRALPETRLKMYEKIKAVLVEGKAEEAIASGLAESIEHALNEKAPFSKDNSELKKQYLSRARELIFNMKSNEVMCSSSTFLSF